MTHAPLRALPADARVSMWHASDDWPHRRHDWPVPSGRRGRMLFQTGRSDPFEKYLDAMAHRRERGWSITSLDWRGQGGSGRLGFDPRVGHAERFAPMVDDRLVDPRMACRLAARLPYGEVVRFGPNESAHGILREGEPTRTRALAAIDVFLDRTAP